MANKLKETIGLGELTQKNNRLGQILLAEFIGNMLLNFFGCASVVNVMDPTKGGNFVIIALTFGLTIFIVVQTLGHISGAHVNPAVTVGMMVTGNIKVAKGILYIIAQCLGSLAGSAALKALTPEHAQGKLGLTSVQTGSEVQALGVEFFLGFVLVLVVFGVCDPNRPDVKSTGPLAIGLAVAVGHLATVDYTGSSMNPARTFGSAVIANDWDGHWVYWVGPCLGGIAAALLYSQAFSAPPCGTVKIIERYTAVATEEKELKRLDGGGSKVDVNLA